MLPIPPVYLRKTPSCPMGSRAYCSTGDCPLCGRKTRRHSLIPGDSPLQERLT